MTNEEYEHAVEHRLPIPLGEELWRCGPPPLDSLLTIHGHVYRVKEIQGDEVLICGEGDFYRPWRRCRFAGDKVMFLEFGKWEEWKVFNQGE